MCSTLKQKRAGRFRDGLPKREKRCQGFKPRQRWGYKLFDQHHLFLEDAIACFEAIEINT